MDFDCCSYVTGLKTQATRQVSVHHLVFMHERGGCLALISEVRVMIELCLAFLCLWSSTLYVKILYDIKRAYMM